MHSRREKGIQTVTFRFAALLAIAFVVSAIAITAIVVAKPDKLQDSPVPFTGGQWLCLSPPPLSSVRVVVGPVWLNGTSPPVATFDLRGIPTANLFIKAYLPPCFSIPRAHEDYRREYANRFDSFRITIVDDTETMVYDSQTFGREIVHPESPVWMLGGHDGELFLWSSPSPKVLFRNDRTYRIVVDGTGLKSPPCPPFLEIRLDSPLGDAAAESRDGDERLPRR